MKMTTLCYIEDSGKWLMLYRNKKENDENAGKYIGVGGKMEAGESPDECMIREVFEETGLRIRAYSFKGVISFINEIWGDEYMLLYKADSFDGDLREDCPEGRLEWIPKEEVLNLPLWEGDIPFLKALLEDKDQINMKLIYHNDKLVDVISYDGTNRDEAK